MTTKILIHKSNNNSNIFKIKTKEYVPVVSYVRTSSNFLTRLRKYKIYLNKKKKKLI